MEVAIFYHQPIRFEDPVKLRAQTPVSLQLGP